MERKIACITGATSGIGWATALHLAKEDYAILACGRRKDRLEELSTKLSPEIPFRYLVFDVRDQEQVISAFDSLPVEWQPIEVLVNNAGNAHGLDTIDQGDVEDWDAMVDINVKGLLYVSRKIIPGMVDRKSGQIINIGSIAGKEVYAKGSVYCASKYAVDALTKGMRIDLNPHGIKVMGIHPGAVETEFSLVRFKGDTERASGVYQGFDPLTADDVAEIIAFAVTRPKHVVMADVLLLPLAQGSATVFNRNSE
ncbi:Oxidoreductase, short chain dehydrogenase/reductase family [Lunatimonas lonarensis]|uniref:Oxidoreductase, short chain dehydrogenase/reductase family n=1 Tax=Lunatimonas lonarensis TaxID=1232681 RepID=R7ZU06_9BACT|nr:SDR family NAD(P)-dependent oxidoreductase [Lunatimonas lonarensis]EON77626.1 Oxidoreductase, short chain dehydrogenase/reductase family [Lunatimonas lonarensis]